MLLTENEFFLIILRLDIGAIFSNLKMLSAEHSDASDDEDFDNYQGMLNLLLMRMFVRSK